MMNLSFVDAALCGGGGGGTRGGVPDVLKHFESEQLSLCVIDMNDMPPPPSPTPNQPCFLSLGLSPPHFKSLCRWILFPFIVMEDWNRKRTSCCFL